LRQGCFVFPLFALSFLELSNKYLKNPEMWPSGGGFPYVALFPRAPQGAAPNGVKVFHAQ
jgi:hypothetical protein